MESPRVYLAVDNCFAYKRWTRPAEWMKLVREAGLSYVEASADTELDPCYMGRDYLGRWVREVKAAERTYGVKVANLYSGHGSYITLGLAHTDPGVRRHIKENWFYPMIDTAAELQAGFGFFAHGFAMSVLAEPEVYREYTDLLYDQFAELAFYAQKAGCGKIGVEQMYSPHQIPWKIDETAEMLRTIKKKGVDFYITEDVGHHHLKFVTPDKNQLTAALQRGQDKGLWLGTDRAYRYYREALREPERREELVSRILGEAQAHPYLFATPRDGDCYEWLRRLGCYAPIIHLQQTDGLHSDHSFFTRENNAAGIIRTEKVLRAVRQSYRNGADGELPKRCDAVYLTIEGFLGTASIPEDGLAELKETVEYLRETVPKDGLRIDELLDGEEKHA